MLFFNAPLAARLPGILSDILAVLSTNGTFFCVGEHLLTVKKYREFMRRRFCEWQNDGALVALHEFIKKTQKTPDNELALARRRQKELSK
jgi:hypothetical protein